MGEDMEKKNKKRVTAQDVADLAGVSRGTVDRVLKNRPHVSDSVRDRVMDAIEKTGYLSPIEKNRELLYRTKGGRLLFGVLLPNWTGHFEWEIRRGIEDASTELKDFAIDVRVRQCESGYPEETVSILSELEAEGVNGLAVCAIDDALVNEKIRDLSGKGIPVITYNSDLPKSERLCFVGQDYYRSGRVAAEIMTKLVRDGERIIAACGNREFTGHRDRIEGFLSGCRDRGIESDRIEVIETYNDYSVTLRKISELLNDGTIRGIYMANRSVTGCVRAVEDASLRGRVHVICHDISEQTVKYLQSGAIDFSISQDIHEQGYLPLIMLRNYLQKNISPSEYDIKSFQSMNVVCAENL